MDLVLVKTIKSGFKVTYVKKMKEQIAICVRATTMLELSFSG